MRLNKKGFVIIMVMAFLAIILLVAGAVVSIGCSEILQTRIRNDLVSAYYVASAGAEKMYVTLKSQTVVTWGQSISGSLSLSGSTVGTFTATAVKLSDNEFCIVSNGIVNYRTARAVVKYGYISDISLGIPLGSLGSISLTGATAPAKLKIEGPIISNSTVQTSGSVEVTDIIIQNQYPPISTPTFWCDADLNPKTVFDTNNDTDYATDTDGDGVVTLAEAIAEGKQAAFDADNAYSKDNGNADQTQNDKYKIDEKDAFYYYFTVDLNSKYNLGIAPGQPNYYSTDMSFDPGDISSNVPVIFIDGNVSIDQNDQNWTGNVTLIHTIAATGQISISKPTNRPSDILTLVAYNNVYTTGVMGDGGGVRGDLIVYTDNNFIAENGGRANASIFAKGTIAINTIGDDQGKDHRILNKSTINWANPPIGLPKGYAIIPIDFAIQNDSTYKSIWQRD